MDSRIHEQLGFMEQELQALKQSAIQRDRTIFELQTQLRQLQQQFTTLKQQRQSPDKEPDAE